MSSGAGDIVSRYKEHTARKVSYILTGIFLLFLAAVYSISTGPIDIPLLDVIRTLAGQSISPTWDSAIWNIRLPQVLTAIVAGAGLAISGVVMQSILRNPLGSPFTLGISNAAAFGAAFSIIILGAGSTSSSVGTAVTINNPYTTTIAAFVFAMIATAVILMFARIRGTTPEVMILIGVAMGSLFTAGTMFLQYFADDVQLASMVFWTFGDTSRASWEELGLISVIVIIAFVYFTLNRWKYNAIDAGDETAKGLGVDVEKVRLWGMIWASLVTAITVAFLGVIGFIGLICPHMVRRLIGDDHRFLITGSVVMGALLLLCADTVARAMIQPYQLPVAVLTSFLGAPAFIYIILKWRRI
ncbi:transport system permease protein [Methanosalsum zhilinae DSM 4017]|uniref:Cobalamin import system permease protein BtuC n=1 Tax=Methanosalsum zhilinae (strain DSM 4017 / NBRC 107636 / OCM 62 / WeN5) TaxID=679901 RepID=F7XLK8_METZD|nr:iron ABC transporter permease [Methanosalsum zhilinae]AEH60827.1 transport system permease protein [Methanosalsum zhilinae DSM 4017]